MSQVSQIYTYWFFLCEQMYAVPFLSGTLCRPLYFRKTAILGTDFDWTCFCGRKPL